MLSAAHRRALDEGGELRLILPAGGTVVRVLAITGLDRWIPCFPGLDQALAAPRPSHPRQPGRPADGTEVLHGMGYHVDPADFIQPERDTITGDAPVAAWRWRQVPAPAGTSLPPRRSSWENTRYLNYRVYLAERTVGETISRAATFLTQLAPL